MVIMFSLNQAALLSIQLFVMCQVFADIHQVDHRDVLVPRGDSVMLICNTSKENATFIQWTKGTSVFVHATLKNLNSSNFTSERVKIDPNSPSQLNISNVQHDDAGLYTCSVTRKFGKRITEWNLTVSGKPEEITPSRYFLYILPLVIGFLLCCFTSAVCLYRKLRARTPNQNSGQDQFHLESGREVVAHQPQDGTDTRTNNKRRSQYMERLNSIYGVY